MACMDRSFSSFVLYANSSGLRRKFNEPEVLLDKLKPFIVAVT